MVHTEFPTHLIVTKRHECRHVAFFSSNQKNVRSGVSALSTTSNSFGIANGRLDSQANGIDESLKQQALAEEEAAMNQFKVVSSRAPKFLSEYFDFPVEGLSTISPDRQPLLEQFLVRLDGFLLAAAGGLLLGGASGPRVEEGVRGPAAARESLHGRFRAAGCSHLQLAAPAAAECLGEQRER